MKLLLFTASVAALLLTFGSYKHGSVTMAAEDDYRRISPFSRPAYDAMKFAAPQFGVHFTVPIYAANWRLGSVPRWHGIRVIFLGRNTTEKYYRVCRAHVGFNGYIWNRQNVPESLSFGREVDNCW